MLFGVGGTLLGIVVVPLVLETHVEPPCYAQLSLLVPPDLHCPRGHFPGLPIVPGAMQPGWVLAFASELLGLRRVLLGGAGA